MKLLSVFAMLLSLALSTGCAGTESQLASDEGVTTYGVIDVGITSRSER